MNNFNKFDTGARKDLGEKLMMDLVTPEMVEALAEVLTYGSKKYAARNWEKGIPIMTSVAASQRHLMQFLKGIDLDEESGLKHIEQAFLNLGMVVTQLRRNRLDLDDRPTTRQVETEEAIAQPSKTKSSDIVDSLLFDSDRVKRFKKMVAEAENTVTYTEMCGVPNCSYCRMDRLQKNGGF